MLLVAFRDELRNAQGGAGAKAQEGEEGLVSGASLALVLMQELGGKSWPWLHKNIVLLIAPGRSRSLFDRPTDRSITRSSNLRRRGEQQS